MATFVNNLRLTEITTGDESGTWGTTTNANWDFVTDAFGYGTKNMASDADVTYTMADGSVDTLRSMYLKITSGVSLSATRTITIAPNTVSKVWIIENATTGGQSIIIKQGSGATVTVATGTKAMVYSDGAGAGAAVVLSNPTVSLSSGVTGTLPIANGGTGATTLTANNVILGNGTSAPLFVAPGSSGNVLTSNGTTWSSAVLPAGGLTYVVKTANYTTQDKEGVLADTSGGAFTVTLPAAPATGAQVVVADSGASWGTNNLTVGRNGSTIGGLAQDLVCDITGVSVQLVYDGTTWEVYAQIGGNGGTAVTLDGVQTLTNKTISGASNTINNVPLSTAVTGTLPVANGGTGAATLTANNVLLGNGTSALQAVAPGSSGNVLTSDGTTWASAAPSGKGGATQVGSLIIPQTDNRIGYAANPANQILRTGWLYLPEQFCISGGVLIKSNLGTKSPKYSTFYGGWLAVGQANNASGALTSFVMLSTNGQDWVPLMEIDTIGGYAKANTNDQTHSLAVDETNGRIFTLWEDSIASTAGFAYQTTAASATSTWTVSAAILDGSAGSQTPQFGSIEYVDMGTTGTSGVVITGKALGTGIIIFVIAAGGTTSSTRYSGGYPGSNNYGSRLVWNASAKKAMVVTANGGAAYNQIVAVANDVNQSWTLQTALTVPAATNYLSSGTAMSSSYNVYSSGNTTLYYSTTYSGWTSTSPGIGSIYSLTHNGTNWIALTENGLYYSTNATPTGFTQVGIRPQNNAIYRTFGQRRI
jgi:hypothetical protein